LSGAAGAGVLHLHGSARDLAVFAERAARHDPGAPVRLVGVGTTVAAFVTTPFECLGLRATRLREPADLDVLVEAVGLGARARTARDGVLTLPPRLPDLQWTSPLPPRSGWTAVATLSARQVAAQVRADTDEFRRRAGAVDPGRGSSAAMEGLALELWGRNVVADTPARLLHAADYLGFVPEQPGSVATIRSVGPWRRLDTDLGVTAVRISDPLGLLLR
jgi:hypothetical protein